jgi:hypothetical protein
VFGGVGLDLTALTGIVEVDDASLLVNVRAGTFGDVFEEELRAKHNLTCGHWPQSINLSTVGGWAACRGAGQYSTRYGKIEDIVRGLEVVLANGTVVRTGGRGPRQAAGPDLNQLFVGSQQPYDRLPYFFSDQFDLGMEYVGHGDPEDLVVIRGDLDAREFIAFWLRNGMLTAAMNVNVWDVSEDLKTLIAAEVPVDPVRLADGDVPLDELASHAESRVR